MYKSVNINQFNQLLGHTSKAKTHLVANYYGVKLTLKFEICTYCTRKKQDKPTSQNKYPIKRGANHQEITYLTTPVQ